MRHLTSLSHGGKFVSFRGPSSHFFSVLSYKGLVCSDDLHLCFKIVFYPYAKWIQQLAKWKLKFDV